VIRVRPLGKPAPDIYLLVAERLDVLASHCLAIEDSAPGCRSALSAGMTVVAVPNEDTKTADFSDVDYIFSSLRDVSEELDTLLAELARQ
jgi:pseudouridine-5'-monophosphatase